MKFFSKKISTSLETAKQNIQNKFDSERIQMVEISKLKFDNDFKELFAQEPEKVERIAHDMKEHGFDKSQPIIATKDGSILDGNSRFMAANQIGIKYVPVIYKDFADVKLAEQLKKSERQVQKMREISKKADEQTLDKVASGELTINQAYSVVKEFKHLKNFKTYSQTSIIKAEFNKGVKFALDELANGKTAEEILATL